MQMYNKRNFEIISIAYDKINSNRNIYKKESFLSSNKIF